MKKYSLIQLFICSIVIFSILSCGPSKSDIKKREKEIIDSVNFAIFQKKKQDSIDKAKLDSIANASIDVWDITIENGLIVGDQAVGKYIL